PEREEKLKAVMRSRDRFNVLVTSYDLLKRDMACYQEIRFRYQVIDEAQYIKNAATQSAKAVKSIDVKTRFALTGTPVENRLSELWSIFDYLMPGFLFGSQYFKKEYETPIVKEGDEDALLRLRRIIGPFVLRRVKRDVLKELPEKLEQVVYSNFEDEQKKLYTANAVQLKEKLESGGFAQAGEGKLQILAELMRLRQICCDPRLCYENYRNGSAKLETCMDLIRRGVSGEHKILLFSQFTSMLELVEARLLKEDIKCHKLTGSTSKEDRIRMVGEFQRDDVPVFLISLKAGGTGLNLTAADIVIHYDPWWNVAAQNQATDRTHRIGQEKQVTVYKLITRNTIEENILKLQESKQYLADQIVTEGTVSFGSLTREDILNIVTQEVEE
ncbi:MAG: DEAD/DEAH box helicase, partial [Clostridium sp.]|nr:DEAD/DEAH box helicase [Clostridium sp.]